MAEEPDLQVCATAGNGAEAVQKAVSMNPDVAILDIMMSGLNGLESAREIRAACPECEVLLFTGLETDELMRQAFATGAKSFILKTDAREHLLSAIRALAQHKPYFTNKVSEVIFSRLFQRRADHGTEAAVPAGRLSTRELDLLRRLSLGESNREVATALGVNLRTAEGHRAALMRKMGFESLADLVRYAVRNEVIEL